jgi:alkylated DNA repair protein (DNA oxidative demethylase)
MSVAMTNCGGCGWVGSLGYRYDGIDPDSGKAWPAMRRCFATRPLGATEAGTVASRPTPA